MNGTAQGQLQQIAIGQIAESTTNPRKSFAGMEELKASIGESGIHVPLLVRPMYDLASYELVCGARRLRVARELNLKTVPCIVREMDDAEAYQVQVIENLQRADIHPLEEAEAFEELRGRLGTTAAVAQAVAKEQAYVAKCLRLLALTEQAKRSLLGGLITIDHALLLARLAEREQNDALKWTLDRNAGSKTPVDKVVAESLEAVREDGADRKTFRHFGGGWEPQSVKQLKARIENEGGIDLKRAPWHLEDTALVPAAGPCSSCEKNTKANTPLFGDLAIEDSRCTDGVCFGEKTQAFVQIAQSTAGHSLDKRALNIVPRLSWKASSVKPALCEDHMQDPVPAGATKETANPTRFLRAGQWVQAKKGGCTNVRLGVTADWSDAGQRGYGLSRDKLRKPGETLLVCIAAGCKVHRKEWEKPKGESRGNGYTPPDPAEEKRKQELCVRLEKEEESIRWKIFEEVLHKLDPAKATRLVTDGIDDAGEIRKRLLKLLPGLGGEALESFVIFWDSFEREVQANGYWLAEMQNGVARDREDMWKLAKRAGVDADAVAAKHFADAGGVPAGLERLLPKGAKVTAAGKKAAKAPAKSAAKKANKKAAKKTAKKKAVRG